MEHKYIYMTPFTCCSKSMSFSVIFPLPGRGRKEVQSLSHVQLFATPMDCSTPGFHVNRQLPDHAQIHVHRVSDAIQPSHPLLSPSPPAFNFCQHQGLFQGVSSLHQVIEVLELQLQHQSFQ